MNNPLLRLFEAYLIEAWPFALMHLVILLFIGKSIIDLRRERRALARLDEGKAADDSLAAVLVQFREESRRLGSQGFIIPLTDYSDRLDARVEELLGGLRDLVNILLIIGIAGTMFGVFEFAAGAAGRLSVTGAGDGLAASPAVINALAELLATSMAKAFPVGIVGLLLAFIFQVVAGRSSQKLQVALSLATQQALMTRATHAVSPSEQLAGAAREVREALAPLRDLQATLSGTLQPIVESFGERLDKALHGIDEQLTGINTVTAEVKDAAGSLSKGVDTLAEQTSQFKNLVAEIPRVVEATIALQDQAQKAMDDTTAAVKAAARASGEAATAAKEAAEHIDGIPESVRASLLEAVQHFDEALKPTLAALERGAEALAQAPDELSSRLQPALDEFGKRAQVTWRQTSLAFAQGVQNEYLQFLTKTSTTVEQTTGALRQAGDDLSRLATNWEERILPAVEQTAKEVLVAHYPEALEKVREVTVALDAALQPMWAGTRAAEELARRISEVCGALGRIAVVGFPGGDGGDPRESLIREIRGDIQRGTAVLEDIRDHAPTIAVGPLFGRNRKK